MLLTINGRELSVVWRYDDEVPNPRIEGELCKRTKCIIREGTGPEAVELGQASSYCSMHDAFCKKCGRLKAMTRALQNLGFDKIERAAFWNAYGEMIHNKWH